MSARIKKPWIGIALGLLLGVAFALTAVAQPSPEEEDAVRYRALDAMIASFAREARHRPGH